MLNKMRFSENNKLFTSFEICLAIMLYIQMTEHPVIKT